MISTHSNQYDTDDYDQDDHQARSSSCCLSLVLRGRRQFLCRSGSINRDARDVRLDIVCFGVIPNRRQGSGHQGKWKTSTPARQTFAGS